MSDDGEGDWKRRAARHWAEAAPSKPYAKVHGAATVRGGGATWRVPAWIAWPAVSILGAALGLLVARWLGPVPLELLPGVRADIVLGALAPIAMAVLAQAAWLARRRRASQAWLVASFVGVIAAAVIGTVLMLMLVPALMGPSPAGDGIVLRAMGLLTGALFGASVGQIQARLAPRGTIGAPWWLASMGGSAAGAGVAMLQASEPYRDVIIEATIGDAALFGAALVVGQALATALLAPRAFPTRPEQSVGIDEPVELARDTEVGQHGVDLSFDPDR